MCSCWVTPARAKHVLKLILCEEAGHRGRVIVNGRDLSTIKQRDIPYLRRGLGVVFQDFRLIPTMTAYENVAFAMRVTNIPERQISAACRMC